MRDHSRGRLIALLICLVLASAGCGQGEDSDPDDPQTYKAVPDSLCSQLRVERHIQRQDLKTQRANEYTRTKGTSSLCSIVFSDPRVRTAHGTAQVTLQIFDTSKAATDAFEDEESKDFHIEPANWPQQTERVSTQGWWDQNTRYTKTRDDPASDRTIRFQISVYRVDNLLISIADTQDVLHDPTSMRTRVDALRADILKEIHDEVVQQ